MGRWRSGIGEFNLRSEVAPFATDCIGLACLVAIGYVLWLEPPGPVFALALLLGAVCASVAPAAALAAMLAATPLIFLPVDGLGGSYSLLELAILAGGSGIAGRALVDVVRGVGRARLTRLVAPWPTTVGALAILGAAMVSLVMLVDPDHRTESLREFRLVIVEPLLFFGACRWVFIDRESRKFVTWAIVGTGAVVGLVAVAEVAFGNGGVVADGVRRATATYEHPNNLALFLERVGVLGVGAAVAGRSRWNLLGIAGAVSLAGVAATFSRGALLAVLVGFVVILVARGQRREMWIAVAMTGCVSVLLFVVAGDRVLDTGSTGAESTRVLIWRSSVRMALDHPIWGVGLDQFLTQYWPRYVEPAGWPERYTAHAHNIFLDVWLRVGILGVAAFTWLAAAVFRLGFDAIRRPLRGDGLAIGAIAALVTGLVHGLVDNGFFLADLAVLTWFLIALLESRMRLATLDSSR